MNDAEVLFVADTGNDRVQIFGTSGTPIAAFGAGALDAPKGVALHPTDKPWPSPITSTTA